MASESIADNLYLTSLFSPPLFPLLFSFQGLIERADQVEQVFFFPNSWTSNEPLEVGTEVSFDTSLRNNKPLAINIKPLPKGTVQFYSSISPVCNISLALFF